MRIFFSSYNPIIRFLDPYDKESMPKKVSSIQWPMFRSAREYMQTCAFISKVYIKLCIYLLITFLKIHLQKKNCYIDYRSKMNSIKTQKFDGV